MSEQQAVSVEASAEEAIRQFRVQLEDVAVRLARRDGYCGTFERIMSDVFTDGSVHGGQEGHFYDTDGYDCDGYDRDGFNSEGRNRGGYDRDGFNASGWNVEGYDREGFDRLGFNRDGLHRDGVTRRDSEEYLARFKYDRNGRTREQVSELYAFDAEGYDINGFNRYGESRDGRLRL